MVSRLSEIALSQIEFVAPHTELTDGSPGTPHKVIILIPGIRTSGAWIDDIKQHFSAYSFNLEIKIAYSDRISSFDLLTRIRINKIREKVLIGVARIVTDYPDAEISIICHSMGSDFVSNFAEAFGRRFKFVIFLGSVCHTRHLLSIASCCEKFINHRGTHDYWPILASIVRPDQYSPTGTFGFRNDTLVSEITFNNDHMQCTEVNHLIDYVIPYIFFNLETKILSKQFIKHKYNYNIYVYWSRIVAPSFILGGAGLYLSKNLLSYILFGISVFTPDPPPLNWSIFMYVFGQDGGPLRCRESATSRKRSSSSCGRQMS